MKKTAACCRSVAVTVFVLAGAMSATRAQELTTTKNHTQESPSEVRIPVTVMPGFIERYDLKKELGSIHIGDETVVAAQPITTMSIIVIGKKVGRTSVNILGEDGKTLAIFDVKVDPLPGAETIQVYDSKQVIHNWVGYECIKKMGCGYPESHQVKPEDLPKGYTNSTVTGRGGG